MSTKSVIAVTGATGTQGGGVARGLLQDGTFAVRAITRNPDSDAAKELKSLGAEVVKADIEDVESLKKAFEGAYGVFGLTGKLCVISSRLGAKCGNFMAGLSLTIPPRRLVWSLFFANNFDQPGTEALETQQGKNLVDAAKAAGIKHFVWSTLDKLKTIYVFHFISKHNVDAYLKESGVPYTLLYTSFYYNNLAKFHLLKKNDDGLFTLDIPIVSDVGIHSFDGADLGAWAVPIFKDTAKYSGKSVDAVAEYISPNEYVEILSRVSGKNVSLGSVVTPEVFYTPEFRKSGMEELWLNMQAWVEKEFVRDFENSKAVVPNPRTLEHFIQTDVPIRQLLGLD